MACWEKPVDWHDNIAAEWPAPRDDEPSSLRQDIADELADHLCCALNRERHSTPDAKQAEQKVLDRFGDPARVARKLWLDEMWEKIMLQRATLAITAIMAAAAVAACVLLAMVLEQNRTVNEAILQKLANISAPAAELKSLEWNPVKVHLVTGKPGGPPAMGFHVSLQGNLLGQTGNNLNGIVEGTTDKSGLADLGLVRPGIYMLTAVSPWPEVMMRHITVRPGTTEPFEIVCPAGPPKKAEVTLSVNLPKDLRDERLAILCRYAQPFRTINETRWNVASAHWLLILHNGTVVPVEDGSVRYYDQGQKIMMPSAPLVDTIGELGGGLQVRVRKQSLTVRLTSAGRSLKKGEPFHWPAVEYPLERVIVLHHRSSTGAAVGDRMFSVRKSTFDVVGITSGSQGTFGGNMEAPMMRDGKPILYSAHSGQPNHWTIHLPDDLVKQVRALVAGTKRSKS